MKIFHSMALNNRTPEQIAHDRANHHTWIKENYPDGEILNTFIGETPPDVNKHLWLNCLSMFCADSDELRYCSTEGT